MDCAYRTASIAYLRAIKDWEKGQAELKALTVSESLKLRMITAWWNDLHSRFRGISTKLTKSIGIKFISRLAQVAYPQEILNDDHAVPLIYVHTKILECKTVEEIEAVIRELVVAVRLTGTQHLFLNKSFKMKMPPDWDGRDPLARYKAVGFEILEVA
jgi:hypothetical protein